MKKKKPPILTKEFVEALLKSPAVVRKRKEAEKVFNSPEFKSHIQKKRILGRPRLNRIQR